MSASSALRKFAVPFKDVSNSSNENCGMDRIELLSSSVVVNGVEDESRFQRNDANASASMGHADDLM